MMPPMDLDLHRYDIAVTPTAVGRKLTQIIRLLLQTPELASFQNDAVTDFKSTLISRKKLARDEIIVQIQYRAEGEDEPREGATRYHVRLQYTNALSVSQLIQYLTSTNLNARFDDTARLVQAFNIFLDHYAKSADNLAAIGASKRFSLNPNAAKWDLGAGLTAIRGFFSSVRVATGRILVNVNVSHGAFYEAGPLDQLMLKYSNAHRSSKYELQKFLSKDKKVRVRTTHLPDKKNKAGEIIPRYKTIFDLATKNDGQGLAKPPRVRELGAGSKGVEFWLDGESHSSSSTGQSGGKGGSKKQKGKSGGSKEPSVSSSSSGGGRYISVFDFFLTSKLVAFKLLCVLFVTF
jgi:hypothetical protein